MRLIATALVLALFASPVALRAEDEPSKREGKKAAMKLEGGYTIVKGESDGEMIPSDKIDGSIVRFTKDTVVGTDKDQKQIFVSKYKLDADSTPWKIMMKSEAPKGNDAKTVGLIKKEGDRIVLIYALPGGPEPTEFKTVKGQNMFWLENKNK